MTSRPEPAIMDVRAGLADVKEALLAFGATAPRERSIAFEIDEHVLLLAYDEVDKFTTIAIGGPRATETAHGLAARFEGAGHEVGDVLPRLDGR